ncbi:MAG: type II toxin-antitoxin system HicB family antitoxin [Tannerella sp.]|jgi:predicted RNase H-like HicB family nuclease|nr:type II toxin-antitoxin system HicB family antitoxin [Tannerella sp.]
MATLRVTIAKGAENYGAWIDDIPGIYGQGDTVDDAKKDLTDGLKLFVKYNENVPEILTGEIEYEYRFDMPSFLEYYSHIFSKSALERLTGVNQKQLFHYASGRSKPTEKTVRKIDSAIRQFAGELNRVHFR